MSFGYSVGDFVAGASLTCQLIRALSNSRGACIEYQEALVELRAMEQAFIQAGNLVQTNIFGQDLLNGIACIALASIDTIERFLERTNDLQLRLGRKSRGLGGSWSKVGWQLFGRDELHELKTQLHERLTSINTLLTIASCSLDTPAALSKFEVKSDYYKHASIDESGRQRTVSVVDKAGDEVTVSRTSYNTPEATSANSQSLTTPDLPSRLQIDTPLVEKDHSVPTTSRKLESPPESKQEEHRDQDEATARGIDFRDDIEMMKQMIVTLHANELKREAAVRAADAKLKETKAPVRFQDAVGRKFNFPFHLCNTWKGMEDLIKQAFAHVDVLGPRVRAGHYDLVGPDGELVMPQTWEKLIRPDWSVTMHMWPVDQRAPLPPTSCPSCQGKAERKKVAPRRGRAHRTIHFARKRGNYDGEWETDEEEQ